MGQFAIVRMKSHSDRIVLGDQRHVAGHRKGRFAATVMYIPPSSQATRAPALHSRIIGVRIVIQMFACPKRCGLSDLCVLSPLSTNLALSLMLESIKFLFAPRDHCAAGNNAAWNGPGNEGSCKRANPVA